MKALHLVLPASLTMALDAKVKQMIADGNPIINLTAGQVDVPMPEAGKAAIISALNENKTGYIPATGSPALQQAIRSSMFWQQGRVLVSAGAKPLVSAAIQVICKANDRVLLPTPCYTSFPPMIAAAGAESVFVPGQFENGFKVTAAELWAATTPSTKAILLNNPVNPTGSVYSRAELQAIADFAMEKDLYVIADEVYSSFVYNDSFCSLYDFPQIRDRLVVVNSTSKTFAMAGLRIGYCVAPEPIGAAMAGYLSHTLGCPCSLSEAAALAVLHEEKTYVQDLQRIFSSRKKAVLSALSKIDGIRFAEPDGAFYVWIDIAASGMDDMRFCSELLASQKVALTPGSAFQCPGYVRLAYTKEEETLLEAISRLGRFIQSKSSADNS